MSARKSTNRIAELEELIGYTFASHDRLKRALTHASATRKPGDNSHYERLEFLGDRVLGVCIAEMLFETFPTAPEGELSVRLNALVSGKTCAAIADEIGLHAFITTGNDVKHVTGKRMRSVRADVVESVIAAIYLDGGLEPARDFITRYWAGRLHETGAGIRDSKTALQEWAHTHSGETPVYTLVEKTGPDHDPLFKISVAIHGVSGGNGAGRSKRAAEQAAARAVLLREGVWKEDAAGLIEEAG
ncbi:ribonuclease III [Ahrensia sp. R2A130]|uniref:ribonuclease III n=1 Tax=Ahrensia sp. R2A130 TaxID=744979 RepID=UPI0001E0A449|nr:ribonuclease III [Ahrensia sp. R2A130]EFL90657.1 ribonuclease III [Ahrensia sp. R2A130]